MTTTRASRLRPVVGWAARVCAVAAPVVVSAGSGLAAEPPGYDPVRQTFSALAKSGAPGRSVMIGTLLALGLGYVLVAAALPGLRPRGRVVLGVGGAAVALAAVLAQPATGDSTGHLVAAGVGWAAFTLFPLAASGARRGPMVAFGVLVALVTWFTVELVTGGPYLGLAQRVTVVAQTAWPLVLALGRPGTPERP
jgi:hypothetical protein